MNEEAWDDKSVELCFLDVCKTVRLNQKKIVEMFFGNLIPDKSFLINQDFFFWRLPWIKITMGYFAEHFEWMGQVNSSSVYRFIKPIPPEMLSFDPVYAGSLEQMIEWHDSHPFMHTSERTKLKMSISRAFAFCIRGETETALQSIRDARKKYNTEMKR